METQTDARIIQQFQTAKERAETHGLLIRLTDHSFAIYTNKGARESEFVGYAQTVGELFCFLDGWHSYKNFGRATKKVARKQTS